MKTGRLLALAALVAALVVAPLAVAPAMAAAGDISVADVAVSEGDGNATVTILLEASHAPVTVLLSAADGTAANGSDFSWSDQTVTLNEGPNDFFIPIIDDSTDEDDEFFTVSLSNESGGVLTDAFAVVTITDDDAPPTVSVTPTISHAEGNAGTTSYVFSVTLSAASGKTALVDIVTSDGSATAGSDYAAASGTLTFAPGDTVETFGVLVPGDSIYEGDEAFTVNLSSFVNTSLAAPADGIGTGVIVEDDPIPTLTVLSVNVAESVGSASITVRRTGATDLPITVDYGTVSGTAGIATDYFSAFGGLAFAPSQVPVVNQTVLVPIVNDATAEPAETFTLALSNAVGATAGTPGIVTILDDDFTPVITVGDVSELEGNAGTTFFVFPVTLDAASANPVEMDWATADNGALAGSDYASAAGTLIFAPGATAGSVRILASGDTLFEADQDFLVNFTGLINGTLPGGPATGRILNDDAAPLLVISPTTTTVPEGNTGSTPVTFTVTRTGATELPTTVQYDAVAGTASAGADFGVTTGTLTFPATLNPAATTATFTVAVNGDTNHEANETFTARLSNPTAGAFGVSTAALTIVDDDPAPAGLAQTGSTSHPAALIGSALLLALGGGFIALRRRFGDSSAT